MKLVCVLREGVYNTHYLSSPNTVSISLSILPDPREYCVNTIQASEPCCVCVCVCVCFFCKHAVLK